MSYHVIQIPAISVCGLSDCVYVEYLLLRYVRRQCEEEARKAIIFF